MSVFNKSHSHFISTRVDKVFEPHLSSSDTDAGVVNKLVFSDDSEKIPGTPEDFSLENQLSSGIPIKQVNPTVISPHLDAVSAEKLASTLIDDETSVEKSTDNNNSKE